MVFAKENKNEAKKYIDKKVIIWTDKSQHYSNIYYGILKDIRFYNADLPFIIKRYGTESISIKEKRTNDCRYEYNGDCFEFLQVIEEKDKKGNFLLEF